MCEHSNGVGQHGSRSESSAEDVATSALTQMAHRASLELENLANTTWRTVVIESSVSVFKQSLACAPVLKKGRQKKMGNENNFIVELCIIIWMFLQSMSERKANSLFIGFSEQRKNVIGLANETNELIGFALDLALKLPWSQRFSFAVKRRDKKEKEAARENFWLRAMRLSLSCYHRCQSTSRDRLTSNQ